MDFLDPKKRRAHKIRLRIGYALMALLVSGVTVLLVFLTYGFKLDPRTGEITQDGLLFVDAHPEPAEIWLNGQSKGTTPQRLVMPAGDYSLELRRDGYRLWRRDFLLMGGHIERFVYPFLLPERLVTAQRQLYAATPALASQSPDRRWLIVQPPDSPARLHLFDLNAATLVPQELRLPVNLFRPTGAPPNLTPIEWADNSRHLLVKHAFAGGAEFALIDREAPAESFNLNAVFPGVGFTAVTLRDKKYDRFYLHNAVTRLLSTADLRARAVTPVHTNVIQYRSYGADLVLLVKPSVADPAKVTVAALTGGRVHALRDLPAGDTYLLDVASFAGRWHLVVGAVGEGRTFVYRDPVAALERGVRLVPAAVLRTPGAEFVSFSANARFIAVQSGGRFAVRDIESPRSYLFDTGLNVPAGQRAVWMDGHRLTLVSDGHLHVFDYDGNNKHQLIAAHAAFAPFFRPDYRALFTLSPAPNLPGRTALLDTSLLSAIVAPQSPQ